MSKCKSSPIELSDSYELEAQIVEKPTKTKDILDAIDRSILSRVTVLFSSIALGVFGVQGFIVNDFSNLDSAWNYIGPLSGLLFMYYFPSEKL